MQFSESLKCHVKCVLEKEHILKNGMLDTEALIKGALQIPALKNHEDEIRKTAEKCKNEKGVNDCDTAFKLAKCGYAYHNLFVH